jgi:hypothetical protein
MYMSLLVEIGRAGKKVGINIVWANRKKRFMLIREDDYRAADIGIDATAKYNLVGLYDGLGDYPLFSDIYGDIHAFILQETSKEYGYQPELKELAEAG